MSIAARIDDGRLLYEHKRYEGTLVCFLIAIAATSRKRFPTGTASLLKAGTKMRDAEAFQTFFAQSFRETSPIKLLGGFAVQYGGQQVKIERIFYEFRRCSLMHEGRLPSDIQIVIEEKSDTVSIQAQGPETPLRIGLGWLGQLFEMVVRAPENTSDFEEFLKAVAALPMQP